MRTAKDNRAGAFLNNQKYSVGGGNYSEGKSFQIMTMLLRAGLSGKDIEKHYVKENGFEIYNIIDSIIYVQDNKSGASASFIGLN